MRIGAAGLVAGIALGAAPGAVAAAAPTQADATTTPQTNAHPQDDEAGSMITRYEGSPSRTTPPPLVGADPGPNAWPGPVLAPDALAPGILADPAVSAPGLDVSAHQGAVDWRAVAAGGALFAYVKASEGTGYQNPYFNQQYGGATSAGLIHGAYHFGLPDQSDGVAQANYFLDRSGWTKNDPRALPPALDIEYNPYGDRCYGLNPDAMSGWIRDFSRTVHARTSRYPTIYTSTNWWNQCTGNNTGFGGNPLWLPHYGSSVGQLPAGWRYQTIWQFANAGAFPGDQDSFNGTPAQLKRMLGL